MIGKEGEIVCPEPKHWHEIYVRLRDAANTAAARVPKPPTPLILGGWWSSTDLKKQKRWHDTIEWADRWGFGDLIGDLPDDSMHKVDLLTLLRPLISANPYSNRNYTARPRLTLEDESSALEILRSKWETIAGSLAEHTRPLQFTGVKRRRLVVLADRNVKPPMGRTGLNRTELCDFICEIQARS